MNEKNPRTRNRCARALLLGAAGALAGCATVALDPHPGREDVSRIVNERSGREVAQTALTPDEARVTDRVRALFAGGLTADEAVEVTMLRNRDLRALYTDLDIAQADLVQASLLHNPVFDAALGIPVGGGAVDFSLSAALDVIDILYVPMRKQVAGARLEETKLRVAAEVLERGWRTETAFYRHQADEQMLEMRRQAAAATGAASELSRRMRAAGNLTELAAATSRALAEESKLELGAAEIAARESRERMNTLMGLSGEEAESWKPASLRLADPPAEPLDAATIESRAIERSLDLKVAEHIVLAAGHTVGLDGISALFPELVVGARGERDAAEHDVGPSLAVPVPIFDHGQARVARANAELTRARELRRALEVEIRATARAVRDRLTGEREQALRYRNVMLPLRERVVRETELLYNAMQVGPLELFQAKEEQIEAGARYVAVLHDFWVARADLGLILAGRLPRRETAPSPPALEQLPRFPFPTLQ